MKNVFIHNLAGRGNAGDDFILFSLIQQLKGKCKNIYFSNGFFSLKASEILRSFSDHFIYKPLLSFSFINAIFNSDKVIIGGGQIIQDFRNPLFSGLGSSFIVFIAARMFHKSVILYSLGANKLKNKTSLFMLKIMIKNSEKVYVRDKYSYEFFKKLCSGNIVLTNDSVFGLSEDFASDGNEKRDLMLACSTDENADKVKKIVNNNSVELEKHTVFMDIRFDNEFFFGTKTYDFNKLSIEEIKDILLHTECVITDRMHLIILSYLARVPHIFVLGRDGYKLKYIAELLDLPLLTDDSEDILSFQTTVHKKVDVKKFI